MTTISFQAPIPTKIGFGRQLTDTEWPEYRKTVDAALAALGKKNLGIIVFEPSFPQNQDEDTGTGSILSRRGQAFSRFLKNLGFNHVQVGPPGLTPPISPSPYIGTAFSLNPYHINLGLLTGSENFPPLLSQTSYAQLVTQATDQKKDLINYQHICTSYAQAFIEIYQRFANFRKNPGLLSSTDAHKLSALTENFEKFKIQESSWLEKDAIYEALSAKHGTDDWLSWPDDVDKKLFTHEVPAEKAVNRIQETKERFFESYERYQLIQFIANEQHQSKLKLFTSNQLGLIGDRHVMYGHRDHWAFQHLFLTNEALGAPANPVTPIGQAWGVPYPKPDLLYGENNSLGPAGQMIFNIFKRMMTLFPDGVRIDHANGLVHPWIYPTKQNHVKDGRYLFNTPDKLNAESNNILEKIVLKAAQATGFDHKKLVCEDFPITPAMVTVMKKLGLRGIRITQHVNPTDTQNQDRGKNIPSSYIAMPGCHDNKSSWRWYKTIKNHDAHAKQLAEDLTPPENQDRRKQFEKELLKHPSLFIKAKFAELFTSPAETVQLFFPDLFGFDMVYNTPGKVNKTNWCQRIPANFEDIYFKQLELGKAFNLPEVLAMAIEAKGKDFVEKHKTVFDALAKWKETLNSPSPSKEALAILAEIPHQN